MRLGECATCDHWQQINPSQGFCHRHAPIVDPKAFLGTIGNEPIRGPKTLWPETGPHDFCGDYMKINDRPDPWTAGS